GAMEGGQALLADGAPMVRSGVANVVLPAVAGVTPREPVHEPIAGDFGHDRGAGDGIRERVAVHDARVWAEVDVSDVETVDQRVIHWLDALQRARHRQMRRVVNVEA